MIFFEYFKCYIKQGADILVWCIVFRGPAPDVCLKKSLISDTEISQVPLNRGKYKLSFNILYNEDLPLQNLWTADDPLLQSRWTVENTLVQGRWTAEV